MTVKTKKITEKKSKKKIEVPVIEEPTLSPHKQVFLEILTKMFYDKRNIGHLLFNGMFRLPSNKRLYEFTDEEIINAFSTQLDIMEKKHEKAISEEKKREKLKQVIE